MARVVITGGCGFLGQSVARAVLRRGHLSGAAGPSAVAEVLLADVARPPKLLFDELEEGAQVVMGDVSEASFCRSLFACAKPVSVFHLGAVMSGAGEAGDAGFDLCLDVNVKGTWNLLEAARHSSSARPRFIMASAGATLGSGAPTDFVTASDRVGDSTRATPHTTYGMTKAVAELLLADYSRRGYIDGRGVRLPTVAVRAGAPNAATTGCFSAVVREPLGGRHVVCPIAADVAHAVTGTATAVDGLLHMHEARPELVDATLGFDRTVFVPSVAVTLAQLEEAVRRVVEPASHAALGRVSYEEEPALSDAVRLEIAFTYDLGEEEPALSDAVRLEIAFTYDLGEAD